MVYTMVMVNIDDSQNEQVTEHVHLLLSVTMLRAVDDARYADKCASRNDWIRLAIERALERKD
jgi:metal-responsive CopG/Arc/MetJ family transcriptional regulator